MLAPTEIDFSKKGCASLEVRLVSGESAVTAAIATSPLKLLTPHARGLSAWAYTSSFGGGMLGGDQTELDLRIGPAARCFIGTQASTKIYRNPKRRPCGHFTQAVLEPGALLVFAPDPVQAFANSIYTQRQKFHLGTGAGLVLVDWFSAGRTACGERWAFTRFQSRNDVFINDERVVMDSVLFDASTGTLDNQHRTGRFNCLAMLLLIGSPLQASATALLEKIATRPVAQRGTIVSSASPVREGALLRVAGENVEDVGRELHQQLASFSELLGDDPWARKW